jgi:hypothetical protein
MIDNVHVLRDSQVVTVFHVLNRWQHNVKSIQSERKKCIQYFIDGRKEIKAWRDNGKEERQRKMKMLKKQFPFEF